MSVSVRDRNVGVVAVVVVLAVVLASGARLIYLSSQRDAAAARAKAAALCAGVVARIEPQIRRLADMAARAARGPDSFLMTSDYKVVGATEAKAGMAEGIASEWDSAESIRKAPDAAAVGPIRLGSQWLLALRYPIAAGTSAQPARWAVAFADLDGLLADSHLVQLSRQGYDFELAQTQPGAGPRRIFIGSLTEPLADAVEAKIRLPPGVSPATGGSSLVLAIRPRLGWFPATQLAADAGLLVFLAWLLAFGTHDLIHSLQRSRGTLEIARRRLRSTNQQLAAEMQRRLSLQETFDYSRFHDAFTGLPNRRHFMDALDRALKDVRTKRRERIAVVLVDIARFKLINDMLGHTAGDELMVQAAQRFEKAAFGFESVLARWGGDQFALLILDAVSPQSMSTLTSALQQQLRTPFELRRQKVVVTAAIGLTSVELGQQRAEDVVREADIALSVAKRQESGKIAVYTAAMAAQSASLVSLEADLHVALEKRELRLLFQPIVDLHSYRMVGAEALLRWRHPVESLLTPDKFLQIAEDAGLMVPITRWIILRVAKLLAQWRSRLPADEELFISVNLSPTALRDRGLADHVAAAIRDNHIPAQTLKFELTEAAVINNVGAARETLDRLHGMGIQLMLDDFGTGYSSLNYLQLFPFDFVKIERPFVNRSEADQANTGMMAALVQMAGSLKLTPIAELVETEAAAQALHDMGCDFGQGYYFSEPLEAEVALQRLQSRRPFQPRRGTASTQELETLSNDDTIMIPADSIDFAGREPQESH